MPRIQSAMLLKQLYDRTVKAFQIAMLLSLSCSGMAHHDPDADVDLDSYLDLSGTITTVEWINPHVLIHLSTEDANGFNRIWLVQVDSPNSLLRKGLNRMSLADPSLVQIRVYPSMTNSCGIQCYGYGYELTTANGREYILHQKLNEIVHQLTLR